MNFVQKCIPSLLSVTAEATADKVFMLVLVATAVEVVAVLMGEDVIILPVTAVDKVFLLALVITAVEAVVV